MEYKSANNFALFINMKNKICISKATLVDNITYMKGAHPR